jgi:hypothetical protein
MTSYTLNLVADLHSKNVKPIFIVKNSDSNMVIDNNEELKRKYNSDLHWSFKFLNVGQRSPLFYYKDESNHKNVKYFCYIKAFDCGIQRIEIHPDTFNLIGKDLENTMDLIFYLYLSHGDLSNPQIRPIAIAEKYAREFLKVANSYNIMKHSGLVPSMNQERFGL